jgi:PAS domain S-box-containing protein
VFESPESRHVSGEAQFRALLEAAPDAMVIVDAQGRIVLVNSQTERLFGFARKEILRQSIEVLVPERFRTGHLAHSMTYLREPRVRGMGEGQSLFGRRKDGSEFPVEISLSPLDTDRGLLVTATIRDVTERKRVEQLLQETNEELAKANAAKDRFLATMSHELRTPLNAVIGFTGTLLMKLPGPLTADQESQLRTIQASARHLLSLINDLFDLAKIESGKVELHFEPVSCRSVLSEITSALRPLAEAKGLTFEAPPVDPDIVLHTDRRALSHIVISLTNNAIKFTDTGTVRLDVVRRTLESGAQTEIRVADTGIGIRAEDQERLFQAFEQLEHASVRRHEGTGLGLYLSQELAALIGGHITFQNETGRGSAFTLVLPERRQ